MAEKRGKFQRNTKEDYSRNNAVYSRSRKRESMQGSPNAGIEGLLKGKHSAASKVDDAAQGDVVFPGKDLSYYHGSSGRYQMNVKNKSHKVRNIVIVVLAFIIVIGAFAGYTGATLYGSAMNVKEDASVVIKDISDLKNHLLSNESEQAKDKAADIDKRAKKMKEETSGWAWNVASVVPVYGSDIQKVKELSNVLADLSKDAITPLVNEVSQVSLKNLLHDGAIDVELANKLVTSVSAAAPAIERACKAIDDMGDAHLDQINAPLKKARDKIDQLQSLAEFVAGIAPTFTDMVGANGQPKTYLIVAQQNAEIRSTGGFLGSIGELKLNNGAIEMGNFRPIYDIYPENGLDASFPLTEEEKWIFGDHVGFVLGNAGYIPDWNRVSQILSHYWERKGYGPVDGVIGADPTFLQHMLKLAGPVHISTGEEINGDNAARFIMHDIYYYDVVYQDPMFAEVASLAFGQLMGHLGDVNMKDFFKQIGKDMDSRHLQVSMTNPAQQQALEILGSSGALPKDETKPVVGIYENDNSWSKLFWYMKVNTEVGDATVNQDGSMTYPVSVHYQNMISPDEVDALPQYVTANNKEQRRSPADMITWVYLSAPAGGFISNVQTEGYMTPAEAIEAATFTRYQGGMVEGWFEGVNFWYGEMQMLPGESFSLTFDVTTSPKAEEQLKAVTSPNCMEAAGW